LKVRPVSRAISPDLLGRVNRGGGSRLSSGGTTTQKNRLAGRMFGDDWESYKHVPKKNWRWGPTSSVITIVSPVGLERKGGTRRVEKKIVQRPAVLRVTIERGAIRSKKGLFRRRRDLDFSPPGSVLVVNLGGVGES